MAGEAEDEHKDWHLGTNNSCLTLVIWSFAGECVPCAWDCSPFEIDPETNESWSLFFPSKHCPDLDCPFELVVLGCCQHLDSELVGIPFDCSSGHRSRRKLLPVAEVSANGASSCPDSSWSPSCC